MSKVKKTATTIFDDRMANTIKTLIGSYLVDMWKLVYSDNPLDTENNQKDKNRSSTKTDALHRKFADIFADCFGDYKDCFNNNFSFKIETDSNGKKTKRLKSHQKDLYGKNFNIDIELNKKNDNGAYVNGAYVTVPYVTVLLKAPMTSIFKNRFNFINNLIGESLRVLTKENLKTEDNSILFVTVVPNETFTVNKKNNNLKMEHSNHITLYSSSGEKDSSSSEKETIVDASAMSDEAKKKIKEIVISYNFNFKGKEFKTLQELKKEISNNDDFIIVDDLTIQYFRYYIKGFLETNNNISEFCELLKDIKTKGVSVEKPITAIDNQNTKPKRRPRDKKM